MLFVSLPGLTVDNVPDYSQAPPDFIGGPNDYRACSTVFLTCQVVGETGTEKYLWTSTCTGGYFILSQTSEMTVGRAALQSIDSGMHTCTATRGELSGSDTIEMNVVGE